MKPSSLRSVLTTLLALLLTLTGVLAGSSADAAAGPTSSGSGNTGSASTPASMAARYYAAQSAAGKAQIDSIRALQPADWLQRLATLRHRHHVNPSPADIALLQRLQKAAPGPDDYACTATRYSGETTDLLEQLGERTFFRLFFLGAFDLPTTDALLNGTEGDPRYAVAKPYRGQVVKTFTTEQTFWSTPLTDVELVGMNGSILTDVPRLTALYVQTGIKPKQAARLAQRLVDLVQSPAVPQGASNPLFTGNAFALDAGEIAPDSPPKVVIGTGVLDVMADIGLGKAAPQYVTSHEMGHQLQFASGIFQDDLTFRAIRRNELEADGFAGYFAAHPKGLRLAPTLLAQGASAAYQVGDCLFGVPGSHGTPNQRRAATDWGVAEVAYASDPMVVMTALALDEDFTRALRVILLPDADPTPDDFRALVAS